MGGARGYGRSQGLGEESRGNLVMEAKPKIETKAIDVEAGLSIRRKIKHILE